MPPGHIIGWRGGGKGKGWEMTCTADSVRKVQGLNSRPAASNETGRYFLGIVGKSKELTCGKRAAKPAFFFVFRHQFLWAADEKGCSESFALGQ